MTLRIFLCGDVMPGRGIDQILRYPSDPTIYEDFVRDSRTYVEIAEEVNGDIPRGVAGEYLWQEIQTIWRAREPLLKIVNLEVAVTQHEEPWPHKGINYRMNPENIDALTSAGFDICALANNHVLDWCEAGLKDTLAALFAAGIGSAGAGTSVWAAMAPGICTFSGDTRLLVFSFAFESSGVPREWMATAKSPGVWLVEDFGEEALGEVIQHITKYRRERDIVVASIHWGGNWGYAIPEEHRRFAHGLLDSGVDVVHGHSSHHPLPIEIYKGKAIVYGCGDFLNDYEGIKGYERYRPELGLMYFLSFDDNRLKLQWVELVPVRIERFRLRPAGHDDVAWFKKTLEREALPASPDCLLDERGSIWLECQNVENQG